MSINFLENTLNPFQNSRIRQIQDFYGASYEDLWSVEKMKAKWFKQEDIDYALANRDKEFSLKSTEAFELREWVTTTERFKKLVEFYWFTLKDTQDIEILKKYWLNEDDIFFITWKKEEVKEEVLTPKPKKKVWKKSDI